MALTSPLWRCPRCRRPFANRNQSHSCQRLTVRDFLRDKPPLAVELFHKFSSLVSQCGDDVTTAPAKTRVGFQARMIFASVNGLTRRGLRAHVVLARRLDHPRFFKIESISPRNHVHHFEIRSASDLDVQLQQWLAEAYQVGLQKHLANR